MRFILLPVAILSLLAASIGGLVRIGWALPWPPLSWAVEHGALMVLAFLATLIAVERAAALMRKWTWLPALLGGLAAIALLADHKTLSAYGFGLASVTFLLVSFYGLTLSFHPPLAVMALGAGALAAGSARYIQTGLVFPAVPLLMAFLALTIAGERMEFQRLRTSSRLEIGALWISIALIVVSCTAAVFSPERAMPPLGMGLAALSVWLLRFDIARISVRAGGQAGYIGFTLLGGYCWLLAAAILCIVFGHYPAGPYYDAWIHAYFLGFIMPMIFGHAPVVFPALMKRAFHFSLLLYVPLLLLHLSLIGRIAADLALQAELRKGAALLNAFSILLFLLTVSYCMKRRS